MRNAKRVLIPSKPDKAMIEIKKNLRNSNKSKGQLAKKEDIERIIKDGPH